LPPLPGTVQFINPVSAKLHPVQQCQRVHIRSNRNSRRAYLPLVSSGDTSNDCTLSPNPGTTLNLGAIVSLAGNTGGGSILSYNVAFNTTFAADPSGVPEPATYLTISLGLAAVAFVRRRRK